MDALAFIIGLFLGIATGLLPGIHPNLLASILSTASLPSDFMAILLVAIVPANIITSFITAIFFGIPESSTFITTLPAQRMTVQGRGLTALKVVLLSTLLTALFSVLFIYPSLSLFPFAYSALSPFMKYIVLALSAIFIIKSKKPPLALLIFLSSGLLGFFSLKSDIYDPFLPLFSGMFAISALLNIREGALPEQKTEEPFRLPLIPYIILSTVLGMFADLLPGVSSPAQVAVLMSLIIPMDSLIYISSVSSIAISESVFSLSTEASLDKSRIGTTAWLAQFIDVGNNLPLLLTTFLFSAAATAILLYMARKRISKIAVLNSRSLAVIFIFYLFAVVAILDGFTGIVVLLLGTALGWLTIRLGIERTQMMGAVILPTLLLLFRIFI